MKSILEYFPEKYNPRDMQRDVLLQIEQAVKDGKTNFIVNAPVGSGKSHMAITIAKYFGKSAILTAQKVLQDQYVNDFPFLCAIKGKSNFVCDDLIQIGKVSRESAKGKYQFSCDMGECVKLVDSGVVESTSDGQTKKMNRRKCAFKPDMEEYEDVLYVGSESEKAVKLKNVCEYYEQKYQALNASHCMFNYSAYFQNVIMGSGGVLDRDVVICDEAHTIEDWMIGFVGLDITNKTMRILDNDFAGYDWDSVQGVYDFISAELNKLKLMAMELVDSGQTLGKDTDRVVAKFKYFCSILDKDDQKENFIIQKETDSRGNITKVSLKPLDISAFAHTFFKQKYKVFMSGTLNEKITTEMLGLNPEETAYIEVEDNPFALENRQVEYVDVAKINYHTTDDEWSEVYREIDTIMKQHGTDKGLILTSNKSQAHKIQENVSSVSADRIVITYGGHGDTKDIVLKKHAETDKPQVLVAPALWEGCDLKNDLARFVIIVKTPYASLGDERIKAKMDINQSWYTWQALTKILQGFGRGVRSADDWCKIYCMDSSTHSLLKRGRRMIPKAYLDMI